MEKHELEKLKNKLETEKGYLEEEVKKLNVTPDFGNDADSGEEEADESAAYDDQLSLMENYKNRLADIDLALTKMENGKYGICEKCGEKITIKVLEVSPESRLCQADKQAEQ